MSDPVEPDASQPHVALDAAADLGGDAAGTDESAAADASTSEAVAVEAAAKPRRRNPLYLRGRRLRLPKSRRGLFALLLVLGIGGFGAIYTSVSLIAWTETPDFCGRCHTMAPELQANQSGPHKSVTCGECHVAPGIAGWLKAKINGTKQLIDVVLGTYPTPIPPANHADMPSTADTCEECHGITREAVRTLKTETVYTEDQANTPQFVGLMIRPTGGNPFDVNRSVHWHVIQGVNFWSPDEHQQTIDVVQATNKDGTTSTFISQKKIKDSGNVNPDIATVQAAEPETAMSCYDCHNRVGHDIANPRTQLDEAMQANAIDPNLPYIKREGMRILWAGYTSADQADAAADGLHQFYQLNYPDVAANKPKEIDTAITEIKAIYRLTSTPDMKVTAKTYPSNLGHLDYPGCFRCHDGGHYEVVNGVATKKVIPSTCDTCHTFPQIGNVASLPLGEPPTTHNDSLWVFNHKTVATSVNPGGQSCGACHAQDYCANCHKTGAVSVDHEEMATNHAATIRRQGNTACAYCHQPVFCATCHGDKQVLPVTTPFSTQPQSAPLPGSSGGPGDSPGPSSSAPATTGVMFPLSPKPGG